MGARSSKDCSCPYCDEGLQDQEAEEVGRKLRFNRQATNLQRDGLPDAAVRFGQRLCAALEVLFDGGVELLVAGQGCGGQLALFLVADVDRKSTRLNSSHLGISYAVFCLK